MFERFTDRARRVIILAQDESRSLNHNYIGTEHIVLALLVENEGVAGQVLTSLGVNADQVRKQIIEIIGEGKEKILLSAHVPFTPRAKKILELSLREALQLGHNYIGTEHILLGIIREAEGVGAQILVNLGADLDTVRSATITLLNGFKTPIAESEQPLEVPNPRKLAGTLTNGKMALRQAGKLVKSMTESFTMTDTVSQVFTAGALIRRSLRSFLDSLAYRGVTYKENKGWVDSDFIITATRSDMQVIMKALMDWAKENNLLRED